MNEPVVNDFSESATHLGAVDGRSTANGDEDIDAVLLREFLCSLDLLDGYPNSQFCIASRSINSRACCPISLNTPPNMPSFSSILATSEITGVFSRKLFPVTINALGFAFLSYVETRVRIIDGRFETLPGPQWTARNGVKRYDPAEGRRESAIVSGVKLEPKLDSERCSAQKLYTMSAPTQTSGYWLVTTMRRTAEKIAEMT